MVGRTVVAARVEETRIAIETDDGKAYFFYGFMGEDDGRRPLGMAALRPPAAGAGHTGRQRG